MPNWCENYLGVAGKLPRVRQFIEAAKNEDGSISFQNLYPASMSENRVKTGPAERIEGEPLVEAAIRFTMSEQDYPAWYLDRMEKWGVKWDASMCGDPLTDSATLKTACNGEVDEDTEDDDEVVAIYYFDTPWCPPERLFDKVCKDFPDLRFRLKWVTEGPECKGISEWVDGKKTREESSEWEALDCVDWN
jgi:hypothetical protein